MQLFDISLLLIFISFLFRANYIRVLFLMAYYLVCFLFFEDVLLNNPEKHLVLLSALPFSNLNNQKDFQFIIILSTVSMLIDISNINHIALMAFIFSLFLSNFKLSKYELLAIGCLILASISINTEFLYFILLIFFMCLSTRVFPFNLGVRFIEIKKIALMMFMNTVFIFPFIREYESNLSFKQTQEVSVLITLITVFTLIYTLPSRLKSSDIKSHMKFDILSNFSLILYAYLIYGSYTTLELSIFILIQTLIVICSQFSENLTNKLMFKFTLPLLNLITFFQLFIPKFDIIEKESWLIIAFLFIANLCVYLKDQFRVHEQPISLKTS